MLTSTRRAAAECAAVPGWVLSDREVVGCLVQAWAGVQQLTAVVAHLIAQAQVRDLPRAQAATSTVVWLRQQLRVSPATAVRLVKLAEALDARPVLDTAVCAGTVSAEQATVIAATVAELPSEVGGEVVDKAESMLLGWASDFDPVILGRLGARILDHVAPDVAEQREADLVARQEARAYRKRAFTMSPVGAGLVRLTGQLDATSAATVNAALDPLCHPRQDDPAGPRTPEQRRADALVDVCAAALRGEVGLPGQGGDAAQVVVTVPFTTLTNRPVIPHRPTTNQPTPDWSAPNRPAAGQPAPDRLTPDRSAPNRPAPDRPAPDRPADGQPADGQTALPGRLQAGDLLASVEAAAGAGSVACGSAGDGVPWANARTHGRTGVSGDAGASGGGVGWLDTGEPISAAEARRMACDAQILPAVLGGDSQVLDLGRARRLFTGPIRRALILRDRGCGFPGCDRPARWAGGSFVTFNRGRHRCIAARSG